MPGIHKAVLWAENSECQSFRSLGRVSQKATAFLFYLHFRSSWQGLLICTELPPLCGLLKSEAVFPSLRRDAPVIPTTGERKNFHKW